MPDEQVVEQETVEENYDEFDAAFVELTADKTDEHQSGELKEESPGDVGDQEDQKSKDGDVTSKEPEDAGKEPATQEDGDLTAELEKTKREKERLEQKDRSQRGRVAALNKKLAEIKAAGSQPLEPKQEITEGSDSGASNGRDWEEFVDEFPEMAAIVDKRLSKVEQKQEQVERFQSQTAEKLDTVAGTTTEIISGEVRSYKQEQYERVRDAHEDIEDVRASTAFQQWRNSAPPDIQEKRNSIYADDAIEILDRFKEETGWGKKPEKSEVEKIQARRKDTLNKSAGINSKPVGQPKPKADDFDAAFAEGAKKKDKQRQNRF